MGSRPTAARGMAAPLLWPERRCAYACTLPATVLLSSVLLYCLLSVSLVSAEEDNGVTVERVERDIDWSNPAEGDILDEALDFLRAAKARQNDPKGNKKDNCRGFVNNFLEKHGNYNGGRKKLMGVCKKAIRVEHERNQLQKYAVGYFKEAEVECEDRQLGETCTPVRCSEFAADFLSEYSKFKGERGEVEAFCEWFKEEGALDELKRVKADYDGIKTVEQGRERAEEIFQRQVQEGWKDGA